MIFQSFFFDPKEQMLYLNIGGEPGWYSIEVGVRGSVLTASKVHDVVIRGLEMRHNRQPGGQWPMVSIGECQRVVVEDCKVCFADFNGLGVGRSQGLRRPPLRPLPQRLHRHGHGRDRGLHRRGLRHAVETITASSAAAGAWRRA